MAVTVLEQGFSMVNGDSQTGEHHVIAMFASGAVTVQDSKGTVWNPAAEAWITFANPWKPTSISVTAGAGTLYVFLK
jgi:hypothetical protein